MLQYNDFFRIALVDQVRTLPSRDTHAKSLRTGPAERVEHIQTLANSKAEPQRAPFRFRKRPEIEFGAFSAILRGV